MKLFSVTNLQGDNGPSDPDGHGGGKGPLVPRQPSHLFMWLSYRWLRAKGRERVQLFGDFGLVNQLGSSDYARPQGSSGNDSRRGMAGLGPSDVAGMPAAIDTTGTGLWVDRASAVLASGGTNVR